MSNTVPKTCKCKSICDDNFKITSTYLAKSKCTGTVFLPILIAFSSPKLLNAAVTRAFCKVNSFAVGKISILVEEKLVVNEHLRTGCKF